MRHVQPRRENGPRSRGGRHALSMRQLAHELNSMLDGSIRSVALAQRAIETSANDAEALEEAAARLVRALEGMRGMAAMLDATLHGDAKSREVDEQRPLGIEVQRILATCAAKAEQAGVRLELYMSPSVLNLPIGPLRPIILNGVRNGIESCSESPTMPRQVEVSIGVDERDRLEILIADTGPGVSPAYEPGSTTKVDGHGIGLELCRQIASSMGGRVELMNVPFCGGAILRVVIPMSRMARE